MNYHKAHSPVRRTDTNQITIQKSVNYNRDRTMKEYTVLQEHIMERANLWESNFLCLPFFRLRSSKSRYNSSTLSLILSQPYCLTTYTFLLVCLIKK